MLKISDFPTESQRHLVSEGKKVSEEVLWYRFCNYAVSNVARAKDCNDHAGGQKRLNRNRQYAIKHCIEGESTQAFMDALSW